MVENTYTPSARASRRTLLAATLGLGTLPAAATGPAEASPEPDEHAPNRGSEPSGRDAELIRLAAGLEANRAELMAVPGTLEEETFDELMTVLTEAGDDLLERVSDMRATTLGGLRAKARALLACARTDHDGEQYWTRDDDIMGWSLARDLAGDELADRDPRRVADLRREAEGGEAEA